MELQRQRVVLLCFLFTSTIINCILGLTKEQELDHISALPGQPPVKFSQFSGYVTVKEEHERALFYWLTEATTNAHIKPLVLWLNGGPGCSSVAYGASEEIGPFRINKTGSSLYLNKYSWNRAYFTDQLPTEEMSSVILPRITDDMQSVGKLANIIFLESPAGVGFSYTNTSSNLKDSGDKRTAEDALVFLIRWMDRFPHYKYRDFYISGESYAGHYVPQLAQKIYDHNKKSSHPIINLKGFIVGNAVTDKYYDNVGTITYWWSHAMISDRTYELIMKSCNFRSQNTSKKCDNAVSYAINHEFGDIDQYSIYTPMCKGAAAASRQNKKPDKYSLVTLNNTLISLRRFSGYDPCTESYAEKYYNRIDVQKALHANSTGIPYKWTACSEVLFRNWKDSPISMLPTYKKLIAAGLRIWIFSGDTDSVVPVTATRLSLRHLNLKIKTPWYPWYSAGQVGGRTEVYEGLTFATVRGAGHEVPLFEARRAFQLFQAFLSGKNLPKS